MISSISKTNEILRKYNLKAKKSFGQNFLIDANIINRIIETSQIDKSTCVIEIGPGLGSLTEILCEKAKRVLCFEIDKQMIEVLKKEIQKDNLKIIEKDFLKVDLEKEIEYFPKGTSIKVVSNLPYYITSPVIFKLLDSSLVEFFIMVQKEFAMRITAKPGTKEYGSLTVLANALTKSNLEFTISKNCFLPSPSVDSAFLSMKKLKNDSSANFTPKFNEFVRNIFAMRRKTLINNILAKYPINKNDLECKLLKLKFPLTIRSETLDLEEIYLIYNALNKPCIL